MSPWLLPDTSAIADGQEDEIGRKQPCLVTAKGCEHDRGCTRHKPPRGSVLLPAEKCIPAQCHEEEQTRLVHRRQRHIHNVGIEAKETSRKKRHRSRPGQPTDNEEKEDASPHGARDADRRARNAGKEESIDRNSGEEKKMGKGKPHGSQIPETRVLPIENGARLHNVGGRVAEIKK